MFSSIESYFKFHSKIYDLTRWSILFGRGSIFQHVDKLAKSDPKILDLGCGTGKHLNKLASLYPNATIIGVDTSEEMLKKASKKVQGKNRVEIVCSSCQKYLANNDQFDLIFCSYSLSMFGDYNQFLIQIKEALKDDGKLIVIDFDFTPYKAFEKWMNFNHVNISGDLFRELKILFKLEKYATRKAYLGLWNYTFFTGSK